MRLRLNDCPTKLSAGVLLVALALSGCQDSGASETGPETVCQRNSECWCRIFTGAKFLEGRAPSKCLDNRCVQCLYD